MIAGAGMALALGLTGCGDTDEITNDDAGITQDEEFDSDQIDEEDADTVDKGTGGVDDDDNTGGEEDTPANDDADIDDETGTDG